MENQYCYIEFDFTNERNFEDLKETFEVIKNSKNNSIERDDTFWIETFPKYSLEKFTFLDSDLKPNFETATTTDLNWHFYSLIELLSINYEIEYIDLKKNADGKGILLFDPYSYPYGGIKGLIAFLESFNCNPKLYDDGTGVYNHAYEELNKTKNSKWNFSNLKKLFKKVVFLLFIALITSCNNKERELQFEKNVMYEIYPALIDSVWVNASYHYVPPPPPHIKNTPEYRIQQKRKYKKQFNEELANYKKKGFVIDLLLLDKIIKVKQNQNELKAHFKDAITIESNIPDTLEYKINRRKFDSYKAFHVKYLSRFPRGNDRLYYNELRYQIRSIFSFSRIQFDSKKKYGILTVKMNCGYMSGYVYRIYIKKVKDKWVVDEIEDASIL